MTEVSFGTWQGFAGCVGSCRASAAVLDGEALLLPDEGVAEEALGAELLILSSWTPRYEPLLAQRTKPTLLRWHSSLLQTELSGEIETLLDVVARCDGGALAGIVVSDEQVGHALGRKGVVYLPEVLDFAEYQGVAAAAVGGVNVSLFGEGHGRKNLLVQSAAFEQVRRRRGAGDWTLHLNGQTRRRPYYGAWLDAAGTPYVDHGFLPRDEYLALVAAMNVGLVAGLSESYGLVAADHVALGVPIVSSHAVLSVPLAAARAEHAADVDRVALALERALDEPALAAEARIALGAEAAQREQVARRALAELVSASRSR